MGKFRDKLNSNEGSVFNGVVIAYTLIGFHIVIALAIPAIIIFARGFIIYLPWILGITLSLTAGVGYLWWRRVKKVGTGLGDIMNDPAFRGRSVEIKLLGGLASVRVGRSHEPIMVEHVPPVKQLEAPEVDRARLLANLGQLVEDGLISADEFKEAKKGIMGQCND